MLHPARARFIVKVLCVTAKARRTQMTREFRAEFFRTLFLLLTFTAMGAAQTATGEVSGTVADKSGGSVAGATARLINQETQIVDQVQTNPAGYFLFINVKPGTYV